MMTMDNSAALKAQLSSLYAPHESAASLQNHIISFRQTWRQGSRARNHDYVLMVVVNASAADIRAQTRDGGVNKTVRMALRGGGPSIVGQWKRAAAIEQAKRNKLFELVSGMDPALGKHIEVLHKKGSYTADQLLDVCAVQSDVRHIRAALAQLDDDDNSNSNTPSPPPPPWRPDSVGVVVLQRQFTLMSNAFVVHHECCVPGGWTCVANRGFQATFGHFLGAESSIPCFLMVVETSTRHVEELYENQRWLPIRGWATTYLPFERPPFTDRTGRAKDKLTTRLPRGWRWISGWALTSEWMYGTSFDGVFVHYPKPTSLVRKRRWARVMEVMPRPSSSPKAAQVDAATTSTSTTTSTTIITTTGGMDDDETRVQSGCLSPVVSNHSCESGEWERAEDYLP